MEGIKTFFSATLTLVLGVVIGYTAKSFDGASQGQVRQALYVACATGPNYDASESQKPGYCSRLSIDALLSTAYGHSVVTPSTDPQEIARYEQVMLNLRSGD